MGTISGTGKRRRILGFGDLIRDGPNPLARSLYLHTVSRCVPDAITQLVALDGQESSLRDWAHTWGFEDEWALDAARLHATRWRNDPSIAGLWIVATMAWEPVFPNGPSWNPLTETLASFRRRVETYIAEVKRTPGMQPAPEKRGAIDPGKDHFEWLALHHVAGLTYERITERYENTSGNPNELATIGRAITDTATLVGLTLRKARGRKSH